MQISEMWHELSEIDLKRLKEEEEQQIQKQKDELISRREKGLQEIFNFYARQHLLIGKKPTFDEIEHKNSVINIGEFMKFCKDFDIKLNKVKVAEVYKKNATNSITMNL